MLLVPAGQSSGGPISRPGEIFVLVLEGVLRFVLHDEEREVAMGEGAALTLPAGSTWSWSNPGPDTTRAVWVAGDSPPASARQQPQLRGPARRLPASAGPEFHQHGSDVVLRGAL